MLLENCRLLCCDVEEVQVRWRQVQKQRTLAGERKEESAVVESSSLHLLRHHDNLQTERLGSGPPCVALLTSLVLGANNFHVLRTSSMARDLQS